MPVRQCASLAEIRMQIDALDHRIVHLLAERGEYVLQAATFKRDAEDVRAPQRAAQVVDNARAIAVEAGANPEVVGRIYREIVAAFTAEELAAHRQK